MTDFDRNIPEPEALRGEARAWLRRLTSGTATPGDLAALNVWRGKNPAHARAFAEAALLWEVLGDATQIAVDCNPTLATAVSGANGRLPRRALITGGVAALAASLAGLAIIRPPLGLWPSLPEFEADYRTRTGERRQINMADAVAVELNTQTSIDLRPMAGGGETIELISGEAVIAKRAGPSREIVVSAGAGQAGASHAAFNIRKDGNAVCVTCIAGMVRVLHRRGEASLHDRQQISYDEQGLSPVIGIDPDVVTAWQKGLLIFRDVPLARVIEEVNRYRPGKIILIDARLGQRQVVADFRLDRLEDVVAFVTQVMNAPVRSLPGGIVLLG